MCAQQATKKRSDASARAHGWHGWHGLHGLHATVGWCRATWNSTQQTRTATAIPTTAPTAALARRSFSTADATCDATMSFGKAPNGLYLREAERGGERCVRQAVGSGGG